MSGVSEERLRELETENRRLREHLEFVGGILEGTDDAVFVKDREGRHWLVNSSAARVIGKPVEEILGRTVGDLFSEEVAQKLEESDRLVVEEGQIRVLEQHFTIQGQRRTYLTTKSPHRNPQGTVIGLIGISRDITERKRAEEALLVRTGELTERVKELRCLYAVSTVLGRPDLGFEQKLRSVTERIPMGLQCPDLAHARITVGETAYHPPQFRCTPWAMSRVLRLRGEVVGSVDVAYQEEAFDPEDGPFLREEHFMLDEIAIRIEELLERRQVSEELERARERAEAASRLKSEFVTNISHELRTPMNSILGFAELLIDGLDGPLSPEQRNSLGRIESNARKLLRLINDILDLSRIESSRLELMQEPFSLRELVAETARELWGMARKKGLVLEWGVDRRLPDVVRGDEVRLRQVLVNLGHNAVKFTESGHIRIRVEGTVEGTDAEVHFRVEDSGIGVPAERCGEIFEKFVQVDGSLTRRHGGAGLGLAISSQLVALMGGRIWLESELGKGSIFHFTVRLGLPDRVSRSAFGVDGMPTSYGGEPEA